MPILAAVGRSVDVVILAELQKLLDVIERNIAMQEN